MVGLLRVLNSPYRRFRRSCPQLWADAAREMGIQILGRTLAANRQVAVESTRLTRARSADPGSNWASANSATNCAKLKAHGLLERDDKRYACRLTRRDVKAALVFVLFHKQLSGPLAHSLSQHQRHPDKTDIAIRNMIQLLGAG
jgi:hypothetical protein